VRYFNTVRYLYAGIPTALSGNNQDHPPCTVSLFIILKITVAIPSEETWLRQRDLPLLFWS